MNTRALGGAVAAAIVALGTFGAGLTAATPAGADTTDTTVTVNCVAHAPIIGDQYLSQGISISTDAPAVVQPGANVTAVTTFPVDNIPSSQSGGTVSSVKDLSYKLPIPANSSFVSATLSGGFNYGGSATATLQGSATTGAVVYSIPARSRAIRTSRSRR